MEKIEVKSRKLFNLRDANPLLIIFSISIWTVVWLNKNEESIFQEVTVQVPILDGHSFPCYRFSHTFTYHSELQEVQGNCLQLDGLNWEW